MVNNDNNISKLEASADISTAAKPGQQTPGKEQDFCFKELYEQSLQDVQFGEIVVGKIVQIATDVAMVDVGWKTEGYIPIRELKDEKGEIAYEVGNNIEVFIDRKDEDGNLVLSRDKATKMRVWDDIKSAFEKNEPIKGNVRERVKGGLSVDVGVQAFLPGSQVDLRPLRDLDRFVGKTMLFHVLKYDRKRSNVVLSRRTILERERENEKKNTLENLEEGKIVEGIIKNITDYGIFIDLGGIDGLLHVTDISWGRIAHPADHFIKGSKIKVIVISFDRERERVSLGLKQLTENPWLTIMEKYPVGSVVSGKVVSIADYGAFIELEPGVEGLIHISEMFWTREIKHPSKVLSVGETINVMVIDVNQDNRRISLGLKQTTPNPWEAIKQKYPEGTIIKGIIKNITNFGIFVGVEEGIDGLVHVSDISWKQRVTHPAEHFVKGQEIEAMVLHVDVQNEKFSLGLKQIETNPWEELSAKYGAGSTLTGKVTNITDFGIFVEIEDGIEGLVHISELSHKRVKSASEMFSIGDTVKATVKNVDVKNKKIRLSLKDSEPANEGRSAEHYLNNKESVSSNLGKALADIRILSAEN
jgi:small subunit ribosomal protein S1